MKSKMNKIITTLLTFSALLLVLVLPAAAQSISIANFNVSAGGTFTVPIIVTAPVGGNIGAADIGCGIDQL
jgi:uncharacterized protein YraI